MTLLIAVWAGIGFSVIAISVADQGMEKQARLRSAPLNPHARFRQLFLIALVSAINCRCCDIQGIAIRPLGTAFPSGFLGFSVLTSAAGAAVHGETREAGRR